MEETQETYERRQELDVQLASYVMPVEVGDRRTDRDRLAATWGRTPAQQRAMRQAIAAGGSDSRADRKG